MAFTNENFSSLGQDYVWCMHLKSGDENISYHGFNVL